MSARLRDGVAVALLVGVGLALLGPLPVWQAAAGALLAGAVAALAGRRHRRRRR